MKFLKMSLIVPAICLSLLSAEDKNNRFTWDAWSTHQPVLYAVAKSTTGPIIEFGCGNGSTDLLHKICQKEGRTLITLDDDLRWLNKFAKKYLGRGYSPDNSGWHKFYFVPGKNLANLEDPSHWVDFMEKLELLSSLDFDVCFIDQAPWLARYETVKKMRNKARFVIVHDFDYFPMNKVFGKTIKPILNNQPGEFDFSDVFSNFRVFFPKQPWPADTGPPTLLGSNFEVSFPEVDFSQRISIKD